MKLRQSLVLLLLCSHNGSNKDFCMVRYNADGTLDTAFGADGIAITDFGVTQDEVLALAVRIGEAVVVEVIAIRLQEYTAGTNPAMACDYFKVDGMSHSASTFTVTTSGKAARTYVRQRSTTLVPGSWGTVDTNGLLVGDGPVSLSDGSPQSDGAFYRIQVAGL